jgi:predicted metal-dependent phosphoesterase TrpH
MKADLHTHSTMSDGGDSILRLIELAKEKDLDAMAITDHDTLSHLMKIPHVPGLQVIGGVEISAAHPVTKTKAHILGYGIQKPEVITGLTLPLLEARNHTTEKQAEILIRAGFRLDMDHVERADGKYLYKQHILYQLVETGQIPDMFGDFYRKTFKNGGICDFGIDYVDVCDAVRAVKEAGGLAVLAHPGQQQNFWLIGDLVHLGLDGLELTHHANSENDKKLLRDLAEAHQPFLTGGSDYHGKYEPLPFGVGDYLSETSGAEAILGIAAD